MKNRIYSTRYRGLDFTIIESWDPMGAPCVTQVEVFAQSPGFARSSAITFDRNSNPSSPDDDARNRGYDAIATAIVRIADEFARAESHTLDAGSETEETR